MAGRRFRYINGHVVEVTPQPRGTNDWKTLHCENMAFDGDIKDAIALDAAVGAPAVEYDSIGAPIFHDRATYNKYLKAHGYVNRTSGRGHATLNAAMLERAKQRAKEITNFTAIGQAPRGLRK